MADKLDRIIGDYVNGRLEARIKSIESRYLYKQKVDNLGIRTAYSGDSEQLSHVINQEALENDEEYIKLKDLMYQFSLWYEPLIKEEKEIIKLKHCGYGGFTWYRVMMELDNEGIEISEKKAKFIYYHFRKDINPHIGYFI
ncbi:RinA family protein [Lactococcus cremoris]|uniref:RinA family protein n=1 Tax=Lactococcus lactis subsp. cremoris TaxID=1359 RepID=UPI0024A6B684|nr:RinA family protein [Lactococcus cremoris]